MYVFSIQIHSSRLIWTKVCMKHPWGQGQSKVRLPMYSIKGRSAKPSRKNRKCSYFKNCWTDLNQSWRVGGYTMRKYLLKNQNDRAVQRRVIALTLGSVGPRCEVPGSEGRSAKSRSKAPGIEMRSTELFLCLGQDRGAQCQAQRLVASFI